MILSRSRLVNVINILGTATGNKVMQVADYIHFRCDREHNKVLISTTDFNAFLTVDYGELGLADISGMPDVFLVNFKKFAAIIKGSTTADVGFTNKDNAIIVNTNGQYTFEKWAAPDEFPVNTFAYTEMARWPVPTLVSAWNKAVVAVSKDVTKMSYQGVHYDGNFAATDNRRLAVVIGENADDNAPSMLLPPVFGGVLRHCKNEVSVGPSESGNALIIVCEEVGLIASVRLLDATFQNYKAVIESRSPGVTVTVPKADVVGAAGRLMTFTDTLFKVVKLSVLVVDGEILLNLDIRHQGGGNESVEVTGSNQESPDPGELLSHYYHLDNFVDGVSAVDDPTEVTLDFQDNGFLWIEEGGFHYLLTPIVEQQVT